MILGRHILVIFTIFQKNGLLVEIGHFEAFPANFGVTDLTLGDSRVAPKGFFLLYYPYPAPKLLAETFFGLGPDLVHLTGVAVEGLEERALRRKKGVEREHKKRRGRGA